MAVPSVEALLLCEENTRTSLAVAKLPLLPDQSLNLMRKAFSLSGTVRCMTHFHPSAYVLSAVAVLDTVSMPVTANGVELAVDWVTNTMSELVVVAPPLLALTAK